MPLHDCGEQHWTADCVGQSRRFALLTAVFKEVRIPPAVHRELLAKAKPVVVARFLSPRTKDLLTEAGAGYADATGNFRLALEKPALFIQTTGAERDPWPQVRPLKSLKGPTAGRVVRALCDFAPPCGVRELAQRSATSPASISRVLALLDREALIERNNCGAVVRIERTNLIRRWARDYAVLEANQPQTVLEPRGLPALLAKLKNCNFPYALTGSLAASWIAPLAAPRLAMLFVENTAKAIPALDLRRTESGTNVVLLEPFDPVVFERTWEKDGIRCAAVSQVAADLLTSPGRAPSEGEEVLRWMEQHQPSSAAQPQS